MMLDGILASVLCLAILIPVTQASDAKPQAPERWPDKLKEGDDAPDVPLKSADEKESFTLSAFKGKKPVVLIFGSFT
jgi:cytochrome oxidase Cu insertion factor (SCO1/SenC/PrrC family)